MEEVQDKDNFLGDDMFPTHHERLFSEQKRKSGYLERHIYERPLKSEPFIVKIIDNQSEHISKLSLHHKGS